MFNFSEILEELDEYVYVVDIATYEVAYANKKVRKACGLDAPEPLAGRKCYQMLQGCAEPCALCNNSELQAGSFRERQFYNPIFDKNLFIRSTLFEQDGRVYRLEFAKDIKTMEGVLSQAHVDPSLETVANETSRVALRKETPDESLAVILESLGKILHGERAYIIEKNASGGDSTTYGWAAAGVTPARQLMRTMPPEVCAGFYRKFRDRKALVIRDVEELRESYPLQYATMKRWNIRALCAVPLYDDNKIIGFCGIDNPHIEYLETAPELLQNMASFIVSTIRRRDLLRRVHKEEADRVAQANEQALLTLANRAQENLDIVNSIIGSGLWYMDFNEQGAMTRVFWSETFRSMLGFESTRDFPDRLESWVDRLHPEDRDATMEAYWDCVAGKREYDVKYRLRKKNGEYEWFHTHGRVARYANGKPRLFLGIFINITRDLQARQALEAAYASANRANAAKTDFLSSMSHDIRTPLNGIIGMTAIAAANMDDKEKLRRCLGEITISSKHLLGLVNEVLDMNKIESGNLALNIEDFSLADTIEQFTAMTKPLLVAKHQTFHSNIHDIKHEKVVGDSDRLQKCLMNLMSNAVKYTPEGGTIRLSITEKPTKGFKTGCYEFTFQDNGIGMSEDFIPRLFEPFARADDLRVDQQQGTGLGMSITKSIVELMNGNIQVKSKLNEGSTFIVTVYLGLQEANETMQDASFLNLPVLVADDDPAACESTCLVLNDLGMLGEWVLSGAEAVARVEARHKNADDYFAVILDWRMPGMNGLDTARAIRKTVGNEVPIIIISAYDWSDIEAEAREVGVNGFIAKPIFKSRILHLFRELTGKETPAREANKAIEQLRETHFNGKRALLVEDNAINAEIAEEILGMTGLAVESVSNGKEAVERLKTVDDGYYDIIFMDIQMPIMDGYEATRLIRAENRSYLRTVPIIAMTANAFAEDIQEARQAGMNEHISKPIELERLLLALNTWLTRRS